MPVQRASTIRALSLAACAVAVAATVGSVSSGDEMAALESIQRYCITSWKNAGIDHQDWEDCTQEVLARLLETLPRERLVVAIRDDRSEDRRELNRAIWCITKRWQRRPGSTPFDEHLAPVTSDSDQEGACDELESVRAVAEACLNHRQQQILTLSGDGWTVSEISAQLDLSPARTSDEKYKAIRKLRRRLQATA